MKDGMNKKNLQRLATFLAYGNPPEEVVFSMDEFTHGSVFGLFCETAGCAIGWAPFAGIKKRRYESFHAYADRTLIDAEIDVDHPTSAAGWEWCFSISWTRIDNTRLGAAKRIQYLLEGGKIEGFKYDKSSVKKYKDVKVKR